MVETILESPEWQELWEFCLNWVADNESGALLELGVVIIDRNHSLIK